MNQFNFFRSTSIINNDSRVAFKSSSDYLNNYNINKNKIFELSSLKDNWDGYGGISLIQSISEKALQLITILSSDYIDLISDIFPNPNGTITIEWENVKEEKISLEIGANNYSYFVKYIEKEPKFINGEDIITDIKGFTENLSELFNKEFFLYFH